MRIAHGLAWAVGGVSLVLSGVTLGLAMFQRSTSLPPGVDSQAGNVVLEISLLPASLVGALILHRRPGNRIGWIFSAMGLSVLLSGALSEYAIYGLFTRPGSVPAVDVAAWLAEWVILPGLLGAFLLPMLFPEGHLLSRRWIPLAAIIALGAGLLTVGAAFAPGTLSITSIQNPFGVESLRFLGSDSNPGWIAFVLAPIGGLVAVVIRLRRSKGDERRKMKLFAYAAGFMAVALLIVSVSSDPQTPPWAMVLLAVAFASVPITAGIGILRHNLYDIDLVVSRALVFGMLAAFITAVFVGVVVGIGALIGSTGNIVLTLLATAVIAVAFQPLRERARRVANRLVYGDRATPYEVLSGFSEQLAGTYAADDMLPRMVRILAEGTGASRAEAWLRVGDELRRAAAWPGDEAPGPAPVPISVDELPRLANVDGLVAVRHQGELLGALTVAKPPSEPLTPIEEKLLSDLASQTGLVLRNARLTAELRERLDEITVQAAELRRTAGELQASRTRLVRAQDEERRRLERNLHDGAQQQIVALAVKQRLLEGLIASDPDKAHRMLSELQAETTEALETLRELAHGIYPPLLADRGLAEALRARARKSAVPVEIEADRIGRYSQEAEAAVYFCVLEALQNVAKYGGACSAVVRLAPDDGFLSFAISDDGAGFDTQTTQPGSGLTNMADRMAALGGSLSVESAVGRGTVVRGRVPTGEGGRGLSGTGSIS